MAAALLSLLIVDPAPGYDGWTWLLWGRELAEGGLDTAEGPAFKPLPVAVCALLAPLGDAAPWVWAFLVRTAAAIAVWLAFRLGRELSGGSVAGGVLGAVALAACGPFLTLAASGAETALLLALTLGGVLAWRDGRTGLVLAFAAGGALLRVETWPFLLAGAIVLWRRKPELRPALAALTVGIPALWLVPEVLGSGDPLRSGERARVPNPDAPANAAVPVLASLGDAVALPLWPLWAGLVALALGRRGPERRTAAALGAVGLSWVVLVAVMAQAGFSGEARYALPGAALVALAGAIGLARAASAEGAAPPPRAGPALAAVLLALALVPRLDDLGDIPAAQAYQWDLSGQLADAIASAGGRERILACGRPFTGPLRGPLLAYRLDVSRSRVEPDRRPRPPGTVFRSALLEGQPPAPLAPGPFEPVARTRLWRVLAACRS